MELALLQVQQPASVLPEQVVLQVPVGLVPVVLSVLTVLQGLAEQLAQAVRPVRFDVVEAVFPAILPELLQLPEVQWQRSELQACS